MEGEGVPELEREPMVLALGGAVEEAERHWDGEGDAVRRKEVVTEGEGVPLPVLAPDALAPLVRVNALPDGEAELNGEQVGGREVPGGHAPQKQGRQAAGEDAPRAAE